MIKKIFFAAVMLAFCYSVTAQQSFKCYPTNWFTGMKWNQVQLMLHGKDIAAGNISISYPGVTLKKIHKVENANYIFADISIAATAKPGIIKIKAGENAFVNFEIKARRTGKGKTYAQGVNAKDFIYLILPDRFSNGDQSNDRIAGMRDQTLNRDTIYDRHGGDLKGIQNHLDYLQNLGVTSLWLNPVLENDMPYRTEHGYAFTDHYTIDPRLGGEKAYQNLIDAVHAKGMKIIQDAVYNHVGLYHFTVQDLPMKNWLNQWPKFTQTNYKDQLVFDPYASTNQLKQLADGWFTKEMPDMNERNPYVANFLIQHALWTVEEFGIDGWRIDTYPYNDLEFMNRCNSALTNEFPQLTMFGETWVHGVPNQSYFTENNYNIPFKSNLQATCDFQTLWGITDALTRDFGWNDGVNNLYTTLAQDFVYKDPMRQVIFLDNHDLSRFYSVVNENTDKYKCGLTWLLTCRGIPQMYYGDEFATAGVTSPNDGYVRLDFPGGWPGDIINKFTNAGRTPKDQDIFNYLFTLANYRKLSPALTIGKMMQYYPENGVYVYFRYTNTQTVMVIMNTAKEEKKVHLEKYAERLNGFIKYKDVISKEELELKDIMIGSYKMLVLELKK
ncbi:MAG: alpha-amylase family glycosyl hydrolase [Ferruginibacter sp.]